MENTQAAISNNKLIMNKLGASFYIMFLVGAMLPLVDLSGWSTETISLYNLTKPTLLMILAAVGVLVYLSGISGAAGRLISLTFISFIVVANFNELKEFYNLITSNGRNFELKHILSDVDKFLSTLPIPKERLISVASVLLFISFIGIFCGIFSPRYKLRKHLKEAVTEDPSNVSIPPEQKVKKSPEVVIESTLIDDDNIILGQNKMGWYLGKTLAYLFAFGFIFVTYIADYMVFAFSDLALGGNGITTPFISIGFLLWNIKRVYKNEIYQQKLPEGAVIKLVDKKEFALAYSIFSQYAPINKSLYIYRCIGLDDYCTSSITPTKAMLYIDEESFQKMITDKKLFYTFIERFAVGSSNKLSNLAMSKISFLSAIGNMIDSSASAIAKRNENNNYKTRLIMGAAIGGTTGVVAASIVNAGEETKKVSASPVLIIAIGYLLYCLVITLVMLPVMWLIHYENIKNAEGLVISELFNNDKNEYKAFKPNLDAMEAPEFDDVDTYIDKNGWYKFKLLA